MPRHPGITCPGIRALHAVGLTSGPPLGITCPGIQAYIAQASRHYMPRQGFTLSVSYQTVQSLYQLTLKVERNRRRTPRTPRQRTRTHASAPAPPPAHPHPRQRTRTAPAHPHPRQRGQRRRRRHNAGVVVAMVAGVAWLNEIVSCLFLKQICDN